MRTVQATVDATGIDTIAHLTAKNCADLKASGYAFVVRYLGSVSPAELATILASGLAFMPVTFCRGEGWHPSGALGKLDGQQAVAQLQALGLPAGVTVWRDLEGVGNWGQPVSDYVNAWAAEVKAGGWDPGLYVGAGCGLNSDALWHLAVDRYWRSCSHVSDVANCGYCTFQNFPPNVRVCGIQVDLDEIHADRLGRLPSWCVAD